MWLLSTDRAELHYFVSAEKVPGGYAILSHVWGTEEHTFQNIQALRTRCEGLSDNPRDLLDPTDKIRRFCEIAETHGYQWAWADTCCIDKTSSAELSEAINSMFRWYSLSLICYVFLADVPDVGSGSASDTDRDDHFKDSIWHSRGWTLQELIAPSFVVFLSSSWQVLGTKGDFAHLIEAKTNVPRSLLTLRARLTDFSIAQRMSWAADRMTTREEDRAYCLMGIFGVNMPTLYGEGMMAFQRLQEEIMKLHDDSTLFAWSLLDYNEQGPTNVMSVHSEETPPYMHLFAKSPNFFSHSNNIAQAPLREYDYCAVNKPTFSITPYCVLALSSVVEVLEANCWVALMPWHEEQVQDGYALGLVLTPHGGRVHLGSTEGPLYKFNLQRFAFWRIEENGISLRVPTSISQHNILRIQEPRVFLLPHKAVKVRQIHLWHRAPPTSAPRDSMPFPLFFVDTALHAPFRFKKLDNSRYLYHYEWLVAVPTFPKPPTPDTEIPPVLGHRFFQYQPMQRVYCFTLRLGSCENCPLKPGEKPARWADILYDDSQNSWDTFSRPHACPQDHIDEWPLRMRVFRKGADETSNSPQFRGPRSDYTEVRVAFTPCPLNPRTLVVHVVPRKPERKLTTPGTVRVEFQLKANPLPLSNELWTIHTNSLVGHHLKSWTPSTLPARQCDDDRVGVYLRAFRDETRLFRALMEAPHRLSEGDVPVHETREQLEELTEQLRWYRKSNLDSTAAKLAGDAELDLTECAEKLRNMESLGHGL